MSAKQLKSQIEDYLVKSFILRMNCKKHNFMIFDSTIKLNDRLHSFGYRYTYKCENCNTIKPFKRLKVNKNEI